MASSLVKKLWMRAGSPMCVVPMVVRRLPVGVAAGVSLRCRKQTSATMLMPWKGTAVGRKTNAVLHS